MSDDPEDKPEEAEAVLEPEASPWKRAKNMGFFDHLEELRWTLMKCALAFVIFAGLIAFFLPQFQSLLLWPMHEVQVEFPKLELKLVTSSPVDAFNIVVQMCILGGLAMASPFIGYFLGQFVLPALKEKERRMILPGCAAGVFLFLCGSVFSFYFLVPSAIRVSLQINDLLGTVPFWTLSSYYSLVTWLVVGVGLAFEYPLVIVFLIWIGILTTEFLLKYWRHAIVVIFIVAAVITPTGDPINMTLVAVPLYILYLVSILAGKQVERRKAKARN